MTAEEKRLIRGVVAADFLTGRADYVPRRGMRAYPELDAAEDALWEGCEDDEGRYHYLIDVAFRTARRYRPDEVVAPVLARALDAE